LEKGLSVKLFWQETVNIVMIVRANRKTFCCESYQQNAHQEETIFTKIYRSRNLNHEKTQPSQYCQA
jgi:hypothetical protein